MVKKIKNKLKYKLKTLQPLPPGIYSVDVVNIHLDIQEDRETVEQVATYMLDNIQPVKEAE
jgi:hypothetical protein